MPAVKSLEESCQVLEKIKASASVTTDGGWSPSQVLQHCAQSIEYSMSGFPKEKPRLFQMTLGRFFMRKFLRQGFMKHGLNGPIPGAPVPSPEVALGPAADRLLLSIRTFQEFAHPLAPHFAYGPLSKEEYARLHTLHLADHFSNFKF